jgi:glucan 1,3-beta-glucosidase
LLLSWASKYGLSVLIDIHALKDSQNGFDNSGQTMGFSWTSPLTTEYGALTTFQHWPIRTANWIGDFDHDTISYKNINRANIQHALEVISIIADTYKGYPAVTGLEPVNEPWYHTPIEELKQFYWEGYLIVKLAAPHWIYVMHDSFHFTTDVWGGFMAGYVLRCVNRGLV